MLTARSHPGLEEEEGVLTARSHPGHQTQRRGTCLRKACPGDDVERHAAGTYSGVQSPPSHP